MRKGLSWKHDWRAEYLDVGKRELPFAQKTAGKVHLLQVPDGVYDACLRRRVGVDGFVGVLAFEAEKVRGDVFRLPDMGVLLDDLLESSLVDLE